MYVPVIQVRSNGLLKYDVWTGSTTHERYDFSQCERSPYDGGFSSHARKRLLSAIDILIQRNPTRKIWNPISETEHDFNINFTTLTISSNTLIGARRGYDELLSKWLRYMRDKYDLREYVWKAELQERGQLHYHVCGNQFIPWQVVRWKWNSLQKKAGLLNDYARQNGNFNPNSVDIHSVEKQEDILGYVSKEISKDTFAGCANGYRVSKVYFDKEVKRYVGWLEDGYMTENWKVFEWEADRTPHSWRDDGFKLVEAKMDAKIWDASERLKVSRFSEQMDQATWDAISAGIRKGQIKQVDADRCEIFKTKTPLKYLSNDFLGKYREYIA